ncbi:NCS2 family permease [Paenibacillus sp. MSJ-34]|uniref:NCS2 family permease n=1 Tax=Paenibacillus sp. MSJ-34 TaxID=2841529 RepID=UPI001C113B3B|nr:NCS2 family permease [Paenibacillus sp. MSJ-34]MBU5442319.1 NCS2 family permease [Paenibacillus sp. MSJ-34]
MIDRRFRLQEHGTSFRQEAMAGAVSFFTVVYIVAVNAAILADAGVPFEAGVIATVLTAVTGCLLVGFWANSPIVLVPGMGINALFSYTLVHGMGLTWQEALAAVLISGIMVTVVSFTPLSRLIAASIPESLKHAITAGIGLFLTFIGLQKGGIVVPSESTLVAFGNLAHAKPLLTMATFAVTLVLFVRNVRGNLLIGIAAGTLLAALFGGTKLGETGGFGFSAADYASVFGAMSFAKATTAVFWIAVFSLVLVILFESVGLIHGQLQMANRPEKFKRSLQASAMSVIASGLFGSSPTVSAVESAAGIASGGRTGLTAVTTGVLFAGSLLFLPVIKLIPDSAIAPVLILIGGLMIQNVRNIPFDDMTEWFPAYLIIAFIPLTSSIVDGMAFGFLAYPLLKIAAGKWREVGMAAYVIAALFLANFVLHAL